MSRNKLGGNVAGYELTIDYDATKLEYSQFTPASGFIGGADVISEGKLKVVCYTSTPLTADAVLDTINFSVKQGASASTEITITVDEVTNSEGVAYAGSLAEGGKASITL